MYNRYIPQPDGSYRKHRMEGTSAAQEREPAPQHSPPEKPEQTAPVPPQRPPLSLLGGGAWDFLQRLLPKDLDTGDLLVMVLLLLMAGDSEKEKGNALLTLALYLFM